MAWYEYDEWDRANFENTVVELACGMETMDDEEYEEKYNSLPAEYQMMVDQNELEFADNAIGCKSWRADW